MNTEVGNSVLGSSNYTFEMEMYDYNFSYIYLSICRLEPHIERIYESADISETVSMCGGENLTVYWCCELLFENFICSSLFSNMISEAEHLLFDGGNLIVPFENRYDHDCSQ